MGEIARTIETKLRAAFDPVRLSVVDESAQHAGHAGAREGGESHFFVDIAAPVFASMTRVERQRAVNAALAEELAGPVHALRMKVEGV